MSNRKRDPLDPPRHYRPRGTPPAPREPRTKNQYSASGIVGISYCKDRDKGKDPKPWRAYLTRRGNNIHVGYFSTIELAQEFLEEERRNPTKLVPPRRGIDTAWTAEGYRCYHCEARIYYVSPTAKTKQDYIVIDLGFFKTLREARAARNAVEELEFATVDEVLAYLRAEGKLPEEVHDSFINEGEK